MHTNDGAGIRFLFFVVYLFDVIVVNLHCAVIALSACHLNDKIARFWYLINFCRVPLLRLLLASHAIVRN